MRDHMAERFLVLRPVIEDRTPVEPHCIRNLPCLRHRARLREPRSLKQPENIKRRLAFHFFQHIFRRKILDQNDQAFAKFAKFIGQPRKRLLCHILEGSEIRGCKGSEIGHDRLPHPKSFISNDPARNTKNTAPSPRPMRFPHTSTGSSEGASAPDICLAMRAMADVPSVSRSAARRARSRCARLDASSGSTTTFSHRRNGLQSRPLPP